MSLICSDETGNDKSTPSSVFESRVNPTKGFFNYFGSTEETSYLKVYISSLKKHVAIVDQNLMILTQEGKLYSIDMQNQGRFYENSNEITMHDLI
eukprot:CAMPEP_0205806984 /NCGR_PEP_ID=MMETSP0205-20121125/10643_1 /ASSEMBLY_ACC=CAM_ASM_000278 /TAXON_ID=36767 /ORGANISM="Euplotes focardii, Strain TN1" /LENGTH=94 /DNA_ID=CAMNT_0053080619 /DNA_START=780 /DNA_END=1061 /DNA_ORIENTATION=-